MFGYWGILESQLGVHIKENSALVWDGGGKKWTFIRCLEDKINRLRDGCITLVPCPFYLLYPSVPLFILRLQLEIPVNTLPPRFSTF